MVIEPTGPAWLPIAVFFTDRGHTVYRVASAKAADLRRFLSRHAKTNGIDADTLARLALLDPRSLHPLELPGPERAALDRRVRAADRLTRLSSEHKVRIKDLVRQLMPRSPLVGGIGISDLAVLERWADPNALVKVPKARLTAHIAKASNNHLGEARAQRWLDAARSAIDLYGCHPAVAYEDLAAEVATEVRLLRAAQAELVAPAAEREEAYRWADPGALARSLPGLGEVGAPAVVAAMGRPGRFRRASQFRSFTGLAPRASETGETDRKGQPMSKAGPSLLRTTFVRAADHARKTDPQLARIYYLQMVERGANHLKALCVTAAHLAERTWVVMERGMPYVICDTDGRAVSPEEASAVIVEHWTVPEEVRRRQRSKKGKAPHQVLAGHAQLGPRGAATRRPSPTTSSTAHARRVKAPATTA